MCTPAALYHAAAQPLYVRHRTKPVVPAGQQQQGETVTTPLASVQEEKEEAEWPQTEDQKEPQQNGREENKDAQRKVSVAGEELSENQEGDVLDSAPVISMVTNHTNGTLNLWQLTFDDKSKFSQVLSIGHASRASGHRFRVNDITCHPVLPLLLTTSHHNISADSSRDANKVEADTAAGGLCSELIMWRVECVGPLGKSGGVSELARVNSPHLSAFSNVAWLPTLLPSTTLGNLSNSPSACFVASDGESLRVFQAVIDARTLLAEIETSERRHNDVMQHHDTMSMSSESTLEEGSGVPLHDRIKIVSQQSTARPGAIIQLHAIADATHDWHNTQMLHVFQEQLITGERTSNDASNSNTGGDNSDVNTITEAGLEAIVDLRKAAVFNEPFYIVVLERTDGGSTVHMWRLTVSSQADPNEDLTNSMMYVPDSALVQEEEGSESRKNSVSLDQDRAPPLPTPHSYLAISTKKVCECPLSLPDGVDVIHATPAAGHLSSASIYPACLAPYIMATACTDNTLRFWKCNVTKKDDEEFDYTWKEWEMMNKDHESTIDTPGQPLHISAAYSGRIACAYKCGKSFTRPKGTTTSSNYGDTRFVNLCVCVYECESTGGAEWLLEDTIPLRNVSLPRVGVCTDTQIDLSYLHDTSFMQKKHRLTQVLQTLSSEERSTNRNGEGDTGKSAGLLAVPSFSTLQSLRKSIMENGNTCPLTQKHLVQLDWVSKEDGSHILTVAVGSRVLLFTPVSSDLAQANLKAMKESINNNRPILRKASSLAAPLFVEEIRWMQLRRIELKTADGLPPLPMQISWVRDGILVVGMDSEMHVYSQWKPENTNSQQGIMSGQEIDEGGESRALRDSDLRVSAPHLQRVSSINLQLLERDARRRNKTQPDQPQPLLDYMPDYGLFEASQMACPVLPQYHPKQLMELLNSGKIRWVKAILAHLVRCIGGTYTGRSSQGDEDSLSRQRGWSRSRTLSVSFAAGAASPLDGVAQITEDVQLDYAEITSVPPLPLWTLLVADKESPHHPSTIQEAKDYNDLFEGTMDTDEDLDALLLGEEEGVDRRPSMPERQPLSHFGPRQGRILSRLLTHTHLPGLSSLDQMHLLALADTVSTCDADFAERFATNARIDIAQATSQEILPDSLDDCGLRFLLAMKHYGYLLRCLPLAQRAALQRSGVGTCNLVWAFHSETHDQLLQLIPGYAKGQPKWTTMRELGVGWWVRGDLLKTCVEKLARAAYMQKQDPLDAALYYLAMKKRMLLWGLFRSNRDERMTAFFANDFTEGRWRKAALTNAYVLLGKQRFEHAAAFFLLGGALKDALEVLITRLGDLQLAMVVARLYESENTLPNSLRKLLMDEILGGETEDGEIILERAHPDPFVRSMALWELKRYGDALDTLLSPGGRLHAARDNEPTPSVFNFYVYLRTHPRLKRHNMPAQGGTLALLQQEPEEGITRLERRLYFQTAHGHFKAGCPALALEVLSKLPSRIRDEKPRQPVSSASVDEAGIHTGQLVEDTAKKPEESLDWNSSAADMDWGAPVSAAKNDELVLTWDDDDDKGSGGSGTSTPPIEMKLDTKEEPVVNGEAEKSPGPEEAPPVDIMAQQLKFVACLKILMEELSTLATGFEVDGGHLRYQLYIWLEREVEALRRLCGYSAGAGASGGELICADADPPPLPERPTLHQLLIREKADFEAKVQRAVRRKKWLKANETLLRTLLSYCSLHGAGGGGLASVRMELVLLLQELGQDKQHQQLLSPLPFPTTLPLLAAAVATNNTVVADPVRHLQSVAHDMLSTIGELGIPGGSATRLLHTLRELAVALSACIYQSLCDSDTFSLKHTPHHDGIIAETPGSHLLARRRHSIEELTVTTPPNKWPGVSALRGLAVRAAEEEDAPRLAVLLAEAFCGVYLALLGWALAARDAHLLYRLAAHAPDQRAHARLFGGGVRRLLTTAPAHQPKLVERTEGTSVWSSLREKRALLNMRLLGLGPTTPHKNIQEGRPTYREQFVPPMCSILTYLLTKPTAEQDPENYDYDSAESGGEDAEESGSDADDDDIFDTNPSKTEKRKLVNLEHSDPDSYSWYVMRVAVLRLAQQKLQHFLQLCGIEMSELATTSPTVHGALRRVDQWQQQLYETLESRAPPSDYIPGCFPDQQTAGPPINKYKCLLEKHNTPFNSCLYSAAPARRLWNYLVRQESVQELFIRAVFSRKRTASLSNAVSGDPGDSRPGCIPKHKDDDMHSPVRIIHKEQDSIAAFCLNRVGGGLLAVATAREVQEMDVSLLLRGGVSWSEDECDVDLMGLTTDPTTLPDTGFLIIQHQDKPNGSIPGTGNSSPLNPNAPQVPVGMASQTGRGASVQERRASSIPTGHEAYIVTVLKHKIDNIKRMAAHPTQPLYLTGGADGSVQLWEWGHGSCVWSPRAPGAFAKVTRVRFSDYGNKFAAADADGNLAMWQLHPAAHAQLAQASGQPHASPRPFFTHQCHSKGISDFVFLGSCSLVATAGHSSESKNVAIWDTLMPIKKALVVSWTCHEGGAACVVWAGSSGALVSCGRRGDVLVWDLRARAPRHKLHAHHAPIKCVALAPKEDAYAIGAADGDIKVFSMSTHQLLHTFAGEHARSSFFKHIGQGVTQIHIDAAGRLFSCGADGTMKVRKLPERDQTAIHHPQY
ncbi:dmX-like protein 2 isoform X1 [Amyelois transitella]|uniref:dmX-like protein 2 isoform X1 n=1 Tax=Amyelois transitella TaxID=680683 RepID=UPI0029903142|nr:dmX-like protein 2 isoform X1 [Amyelois transitella]